MIHWVDQQFANWKSSFIKSYVIYLYDSLWAVGCVGQKPTNFDWGAKGGNNYFPVEKGIAIPLAQWFPIEQQVIQTTLRMNSPILTEPIWPIPLAIPPCPVQLSVEPPVMLNMWGYAWLQKLLSFPQPTRHANILRFVAGSLSISFNIPFSKSSWFISHFPRYFPYILGRLLEVAIIQKSKKNRHFSNQHENLQSSRTRQKDMEKSQLMGRWGFGQSIVFPHVHFYFRRLVGCKPHDANCLQPATRLPKIGRT